MGNGSSRVSATPLADFVNFEELSGPDNQFLLDHGKTSFLIDYKKMKGKTVITPEGASKAPFSALEYRIENFGTARAIEFTYKLAGAKNHEYTEYTRGLYHRIHKATAGAIEQVTCLRTGRKYTVVSPKGLTYRGPGKDSIYVLDQTTKSEVLRMKLYFSGKVEIFAVLGSPPDARIGLDNVLLTLIGVMKMSVNPFHHARSTLVLCGGVDAALVTTLVSLAHDEVHAAKMVVGAYGPGGGGVFG